jgi:hypothetical protein
MVQAHRVKKVRTYFIQIREFLTKNASIIRQAICNKNDLRKYSKFDTIYFFAVNDKHFKTLYKAGKARDILQRIKNYNVGRIPDVDLLYLALVKNIDIIDSCMKHALKPFAVIDDREIYNISSIEIKIGN